MRIETLLVHAGHAPDPATGAVSPPIHLSTNFAREADGTLPHGFLYARSENPTRRALERRSAPLEGGAVALAFASGMAATSAVFQALGAGRPRDRAERRVLRHGESAARSVPPVGPLQQLRGHDDSGGDRARGHPPHPADLAGDALQSDPRDHRHRRGGGDRALGRGAQRVRQHLGHPAAPASARARRSTSRCTRPPSISRDTAT